MIEMVRTIISFTLGMWFTSVLIQDNASGTLDAYKNHIESVAYTNQKLNYELRDCKRNQEYKVYTLSSEELKKMEKENE